MKIRLKYPLVLGTVLMSTTGYNRVLKLGVFKSQNNLATLMD
jgi:hypothetical protein